MLTRNPTPTDPALPDRGLAVIDDAGWPNLVAVARSLAPVACPWCHAHDGYMP